MKLIDYLVRTLPGIGGWKDRDINVVIDNTSVAINIKGDEAAGFIDSRSLEVITRAQYEAALAASQKVEWDGNGGLPPVGCECEYETKGYGVKKVKVECITNDGIAFTWLGNEPEFSGLDCINIAQIHRFRPLRSEADKKRETAIKAIDKVQSQLFDQETTFSEYLYDAIAAGKIPHVRIE